MNIFILSPNQNWVYIFIDSCKCFGIGVNARGTKNAAPLEVDVEK